MKSSRVAQIFFDRALAIPERGFPSRLAARSLRLLRAALVKVWDPLVTYELEGRKIVLPLSHDLPLIRRLHRDYSANLGRVALAVASARPDGTAIDIGANVGDSVAIIRRATALPILCVEGDARFARILRANLPALGTDIEVYEGLVGDQTGTAQHTLWTERGTARLVSRESEPAVTTTSMEDLLRAFPRFASPALVKIDTDGFDTRILRGALPALRRMPRKPVLFFEYDPYLLAQNGEDGLAMLRDLGLAGYSKGLVYDNVGDLMLTADVDDRSLWGELHSYFSGRAATRYMDLCLFAGNDLDLFEAVRANELEHFAAIRKYAPPLSE
jgi:FkbM family methyltransferase